MLQSTRLHLSALRNDLLSPRSEQEPRPCSEMHKIGRGKSIFLLELRASEALSR